MHRLLVTAAGIVSTSLLVSCSGGSGESKASDDPSASPSVTVTSSEAPTTKPAVDPMTAVEKVVTKYTHAFLTGDGATAYGLLSDRCQAAMPLSEFAAVTEQARDTYGDVKIDSLDVRVDGRKARATYTFPVPAINQKDEPWVVEDGKWRNDDC